MRHRNLLKMSTLAPRPALRVGRAAIRWAVGMVMTLIVTAVVSVHAVEVWVGNQRALIVNSLSNDLTEVDMTTGRAVAKIADVGDKPGFIDIAPDGRAAFVSLIGERVQSDPPARLSGKTPGVAVIDLSRGKVVYTINLGGDPLSIAVRH